MLVAAGLSSLGRLAIVYHSASAASDDERDSVRGDPKAARSSQPMTNDSHRG